MLNRIGTAILGLMVIAALWLGFQAWRESGKTPTIQHAEQPNGSRSSDTGVRPRTPSARDAESQQAQPVAPPPRRLVGVIAKGQQYSHAVIADANTQAQAMYQVGDAVAPDNAQLVSIQADHVVLNGPQYGRIELHLQSGDEDDFDDDSGTALPEYPEDSEIDRQLEEAFGPDPYLPCERYTSGAEEEACLKRIDAEIDRRIEACDDVDDKEEYRQCLDRAQALQ